MSDDILNSFEQVLKPYTDKDVRDIGYKIMETSQYFPKPSEFISLMPKEDTNSKEMRDRYSCRLCGNQVSLIIENSCLECRSGVPLSAGRIKWVPVYAQEEERNYRIQESTRCNRCGKVSICIKEPSDTGIWKCRNCYTGLSKDEFKKRFSDLTRMMFDKNYLPEWVENLKNKYQEAPF